MAVPATITRGSTVLFAVNFTDVNGDPASPLSAELHLAYRRNRQMQNAVIGLTRSGDTWSAQWDTAIADKCQVDYHVRTTGTDTAGLQGSFNLETNRANPVV